VTAARRHLRRALARIAALYAAAPEPRPDVNGPAWRAAEAEIDVAFAAGDGARALAAIAAWERLARAELGGGAKEAAA